MSTPMSQLMFDSIHTNRLHIPPRPFAVGGYVNGSILSFQWTPEDWAAFPSSYHVRINVTGEPHRGNTLDVEQGNATPADIEPWIESVKDSPDPLMIYCNRSNLTECEDARNSAHAVTSVFAFLWVATLDGTIMPNAATQFAQTRVNGTPVTDVSLITDTRLLAAMAGRIGHQ